MVVGGLIMKQKTLILSGLAAALLYLLAVILGAAITPNYSHVANAISELIAAGAPNKTLLDIIFLLYNCFVMLFGTTLIKSVNGDGIKKCRIGSWTLVLTGALGVILTLFLPMDPRGAEATFAGTMHLVVSGFLSLGTMISILFMGLAFKKDKRWAKYSLYSIISLVFIFVTGGTSAASAGMHSPIMGLLERLTIGGFIQWLFIISLKFNAIEKKEQLKARVKALN
jgi:hypothetical membrane protein